MKIVFLDIDGPIINNRYSVAHSDTVFGTFQLLDTVSCLLLKKMCEQCDAQIVLTSARRGEHGYDGWKAIFNAACSGLGERLVRERFKTVNSTESRGYEIDLWLKWASAEFHEEIEAFVIIDDDELQATHQQPVKYLEEKLARTRTYDGISYGNYINAIEILENRKPLFKG